jgi:hypothetical protein
MNMDIWFVMSQSLEGKTRAMLKKAPKPKKAQVEAEVKVRETRMMIMMRRRMIMMMLLWWWWWLVIRRTMACSSSRCLMSRIARHHLYCG